MINGLDLLVPEHSVFGFVGKNGAGKTTTMKMVLGLIKPDGGSISVFGEKVSYGKTRSNRRIGYLPDVPEFYGYMKPREYLELCGEITGMPKPRIKKRSEETPFPRGLEGADRRIAGFSRGMKQRLGDRPGPARRAGAAHLRRAHVGAGPHRQERDSEKLSA